jgi:hypothetical protein
LNEEKAMQTQTNRTTKLLAAVVVLQALSLLGQWAAAPSMLPSAQAQLRNSGEDRAQMLDEMKQTNAKLEKIIGILDGGHLQVEVSKPDDKDKKAAPAR